MSVFNLGKCYICEDKASESCSNCGKTVCIYHCSQRIHNFNKKLLIMHDSLLKIKQELEDKMKEYNILVEEVNELMFEEDKYGIEYEENIMKYHHTLETAKFRIGLEGRSRSNAEDGSENIYNAIEAQQKRIDQLGKQMKQIRDEIQSIHMIIDHTQFENEELLKEISRESRESLLFTNMDSIERVLCKSCKIKIFGPNKAYSVLDWQEKSSQKACFSCGII